jgi:4'-phosphopantetheinyl transferase
VDVEPAGREIDWAGAAGLVCSPQELESLQQTPPSLRPQAFLRIWTAKEALVKGVGVGIGDDLPKLGVDLASADGGVPALAAGCSASLAQAGRFEYRWLTHVTGYVGCVAFERAGA